MRDTIVVTTAGLFAGFLLSLAAAALIKQALLALPGGAV